MTVNSNTKHCKCSSNTLILLSLSILLYIGFLAYGNYYNMNTKGTSQLERFQQEVDSKVDIVRRYRDVFNKETTNDLEREAQTIKQITAANQAVVDSELDKLQGKIGVLVQQMNANLYKQMQRNYRVANDAAVKRSATDLTNLPAQGI